MQLNPYMYVIRSIDKLISCSKITSWLRKMVHDPSVFLTGLLVVAVMVQSSRGWQIGIDGWRRAGYHDSWAVEIPGGSHIATEIALRHGLVNKGKVSPVGVFHPLRGFRARLVKRTLGRRSFQIGHVGDYYHFASVGGEADTTNMTSDLRTERSVRLWRRSIARRSNSRVHVPLQHRTGWIRAASSRQNARKARLHGTSRPRVVATVVAGKTVRS